MTAMTLERSGPCLGGDCNQQFIYDWDEVGRLTRARRWDGITADVGQDTADADLRYIYDASDQRVIKEAVDSADTSIKSYTLYIFPDTRIAQNAIWRELC